MLSEAQVKLLAEPNAAVIGVNRSSGGPQLTVVWYHWDGTDFYFTTTKKSAKYTNIKRDPAISLLVEDPITRTSVIAYGHAEIIENDIASFIFPILEKYLPESKRGQALETVSADPNRVVVVLHPERVIP